MNARTAIAALLIFVSSTASFADKILSSSNLVVYASDLENGTQIIGLLGLPLGELSSIRARIIESNVKETATVIEIVDVNGQALLHPIRLTYSVWQWGNLANNTLPPNEMFQLRVYETGGMVGIPLDAMKETAYVQAVGWGFRTSLVLLYEEK
jgi:hypothetical protein